MIDWSHAEAMAMQERNKLRPDWKVMPQHAPRGYTAEIVTGIYRHSRVAAWRIRDRNGRTFASSPEWIQPASAQRSLRAALTALREIIERRSKDNGQN